MCCVAQRCVRRWEPGLSKIGEYTGYCPRRQVMVLLLTGVTWCHMSLRLFLQPEEVECLLCLIIYSVKNIDHVLSLFPGKNIN